jgi:HSP20 family protein
MTLRSIVPWAFNKKRVPTRYTDEDPFTALHREMDSLIDRFFHDLDIEPFGGRIGRFSPRVDVSENEKEIKVTAELPGMDEKDIEVSLTEDSLTISGEKKEEKESKEKDYYVRERSYGSFKRTIPLHEEIDTDKVEANFKKGVLTVTLPKVKGAEERVKKIPVTVEK